MEKPMTTDTATTPDAPSWYHSALAIPFSDETVRVNDCPIHYLAWGERGRRGIVFVHGGGAHAHWWTHIAASYAGRYRVAALDMSGHGDSGPGSCRYYARRNLDRMQAV